MSDGYTVWAPWDVHAYDLTTYTISPDGRTFATTATMTATTNIRGADALSTGKYYLEYTFDQISGPGYAYAGICNNGNLFNAYLYRIAVEVSLSFHSTTIWRGNGSGTNNFPIVLCNSVANGVVIGMAIDFDKKKAWFIGDKGQWNGNSTDDPVNNIGGYDYSTIATTPNVTDNWYPHFEANQAGQQVTANFGQKPFVFPVPHGFIGAWPIADFNPKVFTYWDRSHATGVNIDPTRLSTTLNSQTIGVGCRALNGLATGKYYFESKQHSNPPFPLSSGEIGICNDTTVIGALSTAGPKCVYRTDGSIILGDGTGTYNPVTMPVPTVETAIGVAVDLTNKRMWFRLGTGNWNNSGTANPATNTGGIDITMMTGAGHTYFPVMGYHGGTYGCFTTNFGPTFTQSVPAGFNAGWPLAAYWTITADLQTIQEGGVGDVWLDQSYIDFSNPIIRNKFIATDGTWIWLGTHGELPTGTSPKDFLTVQPGNGPEDILTGYGQNGNQQNWVLTVIGDAPIVGGPYPAMSFDDCLAGSGMTMDDLSIIQTGNVEINNEMTLRWSDDGGISWSNGLVKSLGTRGAYNTSPTFYRLGMARNRVFEIYWAGNMAEALTGAWINFVPSQS